MLRDFNTLQSRLLAGFLIPLTMAVFAGVVVVFLLRDIINAQESVARSKEILIKGYSVKANLEAMLAAKRGYHLLNDPELRRRYDHYSSLYLSDLEALGELVNGNDEHSAQIQQIQKRSLRRRHLAEEDFRLFEENRKDPNLPFPKDFWAKLHLSEIVKLSQEISSMVDEVIRQEEETLADREQTTKRKVNWGIWTISGTLLIALVAAVVIPWYLARTITRPVENLSQATRNLQQGTFTTITPQGPHEVVRLIRYFNMMGMALSERETMLRTAERRYQGLLGSFHNLLWSMNTEGQMGEDFAGWTGYTGQTAEQVQGEGWLSAIHPDDRERVTQAWRKALSSGEAFEEECRIRRHDREYRSFNCRCVPIHGSGKSILEWVCACTDITERKREELLRREKEAAESSSRAKSQFLARMSHELRTPLNAVIGMSKMLATQRFGPLTEKQADYNKDIIHAGEHLLALINDVLDLSRVEAGHLQIQPEKVRVRNVMEDLLATIRPLAEHKHQTLRHHIPEDDRDLLIDRGRFKQILFNLLSNAVKFTPETGSIEVRVDWVAQPHAQAATCTSDVAGGLRVEVEDTGPGIPFEDQEKIWEEFHQTKDRDRTIEGTGLGLSLVQKLTALLGGEVWLRSEPGKGSCFFVVVPVNYQGPAREAPESKREEPVTPVLGPRHKAEVLIIEDHEATNTLFADWLQDAGLKPSSAYNGADGLEMARRIRPGLILLDLRLPQVDGWQVLHELKNDPATSDIPVIIISVLDKGEISGSLEILDWFVKPLDQEHFLRRLRVSYAELFQGPRPLTALIVDDDPTYQKLLRELLVDEGIEVVQARNGREALEWLRDRIPDLLVVDLVMPEMDGFTLVERVRAEPRLRSVPIMIVTSKEINNEDWERLNGSIQSLMSKNRLTQDLFSQRLMRMGLIESDDESSARCPDN